MNYKYSASTNWFYDETHDPASLPSDAEDITEAEHTQLIEDQANGLEIVPDSNGNPISQVHDPYQGMSPEQANDAKVQEYLISLVDANINDEPDTALLDSLNINQLKLLRSEQSKIRYKHTIGWIVDNYETEVIQGWSEEKSDADIWKQYIIDNPSISDAAADYDQVDMLKQMVISENDLADDTELTVALMNTYETKIHDKAAIYRPFSGSIKNIKSRIIDATNTYIGTETGQAETDAKTALKALDSKEIMTKGATFIPA